MVKQGSQQDQYGQQQQQNKAGQQQQGGQQGQGQSSSAARTNMAQRQVSRAGQPVCQQNLAETGITQQTRRCHFTDLTTLELGSRSGLAVLAAHSGVHVRQ